jgi:hypothetical protein
MSTITGIVTDYGKLTLLTRRVRTFFVRHPEWWVWLFSAVVWMLLLTNMFTTFYQIKHAESVYCIPTGIVSKGGHSRSEIQQILKMGNISLKAFTTISNGMFPWMIMVVAMMFPLLKDPIRHVAFSVRQKDRNVAVGEFLLGYTLTWTGVGVLFLLIPLLLNTLIGGQTRFVNSLVAASGFLLAAALIWLPGRRILMVKCGQTAPISIQGWQLHWDSLSYGLKMGFACLTICWVPMVALMLAHHNIMLMCVVTIILIGERYFLPHTSKIQSYAWATIAVALFGIGMLT